MDGFSEFAGGGALLEDAPRVADVPIVFVELHGEELLVSQLLQVDLDRLRIAVGNAENPPVGAVVAGRVAMMTLIAVVPVDHPGLSVGPVTQVDDL